MGRILKKILAAVFIAAILAALFLGGIRFLGRDYVFWNGRLLPKDAQSLDISGQKLGKLEALQECSALRLLDARDTDLTLQQYEWLSEHMPHCRVLWDIPVQGKRYDQNTEELTVDALTEEELELLALFPTLKKVDVGQWADYSGIRRLQQTYPECAVSCRVELGGEWWDNNAVSLVIADPDAEELLERLACFDRLESVMFTGTVPPQEDLSRLQEAFPDLFFLWKMDIMGVTVETDATVLDLSEKEAMDPEAVEALLPYFPKLEAVLLNSEGIPYERLAELAKAHPRIHFVFDVTVGDHLLRTDAVEIDISNTPMESTEEIEALLPCFPLLEKVVMCQCGIPDEEMDALNKRHETIRFVWSVNLGGMLFRTDAVHFTPNRWGLSLKNEDVYPLRYCVDMVCVDIGHNMTVTNCEWAAFMPNLKYLVLAETGISDISPLAGLENLVFLELFLSKVTDYSPLLSCKSLEDLNLCYTRGNWEPIAQMTWLKRLWWSGSWAARTNLADKLPDTRAEYLSLSSTGKGWREGQHYYDMRDFIGMSYMVG